MTRYLATVLLAALGCMLLAGGAVMLWLRADAIAAAVTLTGAACYVGALLLTARPQL